LEEALQVVREGKVTAEPTHDLGLRIASAIAQDAKSGDVAQLLAEVEAAASAAEVAADATRKQALDPLLSGEALKLARREMDDALFRRDRLREAATKLAQRVDELKALEKARAERAEHEQVLAERNRLAEEMERMAEPILRIARLVSKIEACDREIGRLNATSALGLGYIPLVLSGAALAIKALFQDAVVWDSFIAVAGLHAPPVASGEAGAKDELHAKRSASLQVAV
jgi:hypothetical protein